MYFHISHFGTWPLRRTVNYKVYIFYRADVNIILHIILQYTDIHILLHRCTYPITQMYISYYKGVQYIYISYCTGVHILFHKCTHPITQMYTSYYTMYISYYIGVHPIVQVYIAFYTGVLIPLYRCTYPTTQMYISYYFNTNVHISY